MNNNLSKIITRFPPSPTGFFHIGSARTALFNYLFAKQHNGEMRVRIEDTDKERSQPKFEENIFENLLWLNLDFDKSKVFRQSERTELYKKYLEQLLVNKQAFEAEEAQSGGGRVIRFSNPQKEIIFDDLIRGKIKFDTVELGDFVIAKNLTEPLYHLAVVVDDFESGITHIVRGEDHISNTARQILIQEAIGAPRPFYAHLPLILAPDRSKMSKRHGAVSLSEYREQGYLPEAILNYLALLGWNPGTDQEIFTLNEMIEQFDIKKVQKSGAIFNLEKLKWINKEHLKKLTEDDFGKKVLEFLPEEFKQRWEGQKEISKKVLSIIRERIEKLGDIQTLWAEGELTYYFVPPEYAKEKLLWKEADNLGKTKEHLLKIKEILKKIEKFEGEEIKSGLWDYATEQGRGSVLWPMRYALSGKEKSLDPFVLAEILGKQETINRLNYALNKIGNTQ